MGGMMSSKKPAMPGMMAPKAKKPAMPKPAMPFKKGGSAKGMKGC